MAEYLDDEDVRGDTTRTRADGGSALRKLAVIAVLSIALGLFIQLAIFAARLLAGGPMPGLGAVADVAQGVTWALLVCTGVGIGTAIMRARAQLVGLLGAIFAPIGVAAAKGSQRLVASLLELSEQQALLTIGSISLLRALEYAVLGYLLGTLARRGDQRLSRYMGAGAFVGVVLGGSVLALTAWLAADSGNPFGPPQIAAGVVNEVLFPIGCALVIYGGLLVGKAFSRAELVLT